MNYSTIKDRPSDERKYVKASPDKLLAFLQQGEALVMTDGMIPIGSISPAIEFSNSNGYQVKMLRSDDASDPGGIMSTTGIFYFCRQN